MSDRIFIIAEAGVNHNGSLELACELVDAAAEAGANAVKFQTFEPGDVVSRIANKADYQMRATGSSQSQLEMLRSLQLSADAHKSVVARCRERGIQFLSTPFDRRSLDFLVRDLGVTRLKVASGEITNGPLLLAVARTGKPAIVSTGMSTLVDVEAALGVLAFGYTEPAAKPSHAACDAAYRSTAGREALRKRVVLLQCTTEYPTPFDEVHLRAMEELRETFGLPVGYSDHTRGVTVSVAAAALGAVVMEKHFTMDRHLPGPDHSASLEPPELREMVRAIRQVEQALGLRSKGPTPSEMKNRSVARRSLVAACPILAGQRYTEENLTAKRPGTGISPMQYWDWIGRRASRDYASDELIEP